jgi:tripartite-type tricarboxylate transporter receptor subunit TctC
MNLENLRRFFVVMIMMFLFVGYHDSMATTADRNSNPVIASKRVTAIIPYAAGGGTDLEAKLFSKWIKDAHNIDMIILNRPGAESLVGSREISAAEEDGRVIGFHSLPAISYVQRQGVKMTPVSAIRKSALILVARANLDVVDYNDFVSKMKTVNYNIGSSGFSHDVLWKQIYNNERITNESTTVHFKGAGQIIVNLLGGHIDVAILPLDVVREHIIAGKLKTLASSFEVPGISVMSLQDRYPTWTDANGSAMVLPEKANRDAQSYWAKIVDEYVNDPEMKKIFERSSTPRLKTGPENLNTYINQIDKLFDSLK